MLITLIADDLTGSNDSGVQFAKKGLRASVIFNIEEIDLQNNDMDVIIIDTDSRAIPKEEAYKRVFAAATHMKKVPFKYLYKKIDSTLRGNIGTELDAILDVFTKDFAVIAPAYPAIGRQTINGQHYLHGILINETEIAKDPKAPVSESNIEQILKVQTKRKTTTLTLEDIKKGKDHVHSLLGMYKDNNIELIVVDAENEKDLSDIVNYLLKTDYDILWVGSAGLAENLVSQLELKEIEINGLNLKRTQGPVIIVAGSLSQATKTQIEFMKNKEDITHIEINPVHLFDKNKRELEITKYKKLLLSQLVRGFDVVIYSGTRPEQIVEAVSKGKEMGLNQIEVSNIIADVLGKIIAYTLKNIKVAGLVLTGGDTAKAVSRQIGVTGMKLLAELEKGIPIGYLIGTPEIPVITKAGAFGSEEALDKARNFLKGGSI